MSEPAANFDELRQTLEQEGTGATLDRLASSLRSAGKFHELFEALKMRVRHQIGLPLLQERRGEDDEELSPDVRDRFEEGLLAACRDVGLALLGQGRIREGWMYLRPVGDRAAAAEALRKVEVDDENLDELIEVSLQEGVDPARGYALVLQHYGTCNAITTFDTVVVHRPRRDQKAVAGLLVEHLHHDLLGTVRADIAQQQGAEPSEQTLAALVADRDWLFGEHSYHIDTTHLASTVRFARLLDDPRQLRLALDLTAYGRRLHSQFQYQGDEPFADIYPSHALYFQALLGENIDEALAYFKDKAQALPASEHGSAPAEVYIDLLSRVGRPREAIEARLELLPPDTPTLGLAPSLLDLCRQAGDYEPLVTHCQRAGDLLGFAAGLLLRS